MRVPRKLAKATSRTPEIKISCFPAQKRVKIKTFPPFHRLCTLVILVCGYGGTTAANKSVEQQFTSGMRAWKGPSSLEMKVNWPGPAKTCIGPWGKGQGPPQRPIAAWRPRPHGWGQARWTYEGQGPQLYISANEVCQGGPPLSICLTAKWPSGWRMDWGGPPTQSRPMDQGIRLGISVKIPYTYRGGLGWRTWTRHHPGQVC